MFGESALLGGARNATVRAVTGRVEVLVLLHKDLIMLDQACVAGIKALAMKRKKSNSRRQEEEEIIIDYFRGGKRKKMSVGNMKVLLFYRYLCSVVLFF